VASAGALSWRPLGEADLPAVTGLARVCLSGEGFRLGGWFGESGGKDLEQWSKVSLDEALRTSALLLGRRSDEWFAARWLSRSGEWADRLNGLPKYVVSATPDEPRWSNSTVLRRAPLRPDQRQQADAPGRHPDHR